MGWLEQEKFTWLQKMLQKVKAKLKPFQNLDKKQNPKENLEKFKDIFDGKNYFLSNKRLT